MTVAENIICWFAMSAPYQKEFLPGERKESRLQNPIIFEYLLYWLLILLGLFKLGTIIKFIPYPIVVGFTSGIAVTIFTTQIKDLFGMTTESVPAEFLEKWACYFQHIGTIDPYSTAVGILSIVIIFVTPRFSKKIPGSLIAIVVMTIAVFLLKRYAGITSIETIGDRFQIKASLPGVAVPEMSWEVIKSLFPAAVTIAVLFVVVFGIMLVTIPMYRKTQGYLDRVTAATRETLVGSRVVRAFCKEEEEISEYDRRNQRLTASQKAVGRISALMNPLTYAIINAGIIVLIYVGALKVDGGSLTQGQVVALYNYMSQILIELIKLANLIITVTKCFASADRVNEILKMNPSLVHGESAKLTDGAPFITFDGVSMKYNKGGMEALSDISFTVEKGQTVGIIGGTGSGKTTLVNLITHFYDASEGQVLIDGQNVNSLGDEELRNMCGIVPQRAVLFKGTIRDNLKWGNENATDEEIMTAVNYACAADVINSKPDGLDEMVEQGGKNFSGGQRQRLTIARALVRKPEILILDDSASALDYATDARLRNNLRLLDYNPTVFIVSQRTSSIHHADKILVLDGGRLVGCGKHAELLKNCEVYREIYESQYGKEGA